MAELCSRYAGNRQTVEACDRYMGILQKHLSEIQTDRELVEEMEAKETAKRQAAMREVTRVDFLIQCIGEKEASVLRQLYIDGISWSSVKDTDGYCMNRSSISRIRKRGLHQMAVEAGRHPQI